jgi:hypothetical protein
MEYGYRSYYCTTFGQVCTGGCGNKKAVWIDGGIHAREWISPATVTWMLKELVENPENTDLTEGFDWYVT